MSSSDSQATQRGGAGRGTREAPRAWRHLLIPAGLFAMLTVLGELAVGAMDVYPLNPGMAQEAAVSDDALRLLFALAVPVGAFTIATLLYGVASFRRRGEPTDDGPAIGGNRAITASWLAVTSALCVLVIVTPGLTGLAAMAQSGGSDLVVDIRAQRWSFAVSYPGLGLTDAKELVLPINRRVKLELSAVDVVHGVWIPAFRIKKDAVPGITTVMYVTPTRLGTYESNVNLRVQCSQLCGLAHSTMSMPVRVVSDAEFRAWLGQARG